MALTFEFLDDAVRYWTATPDAAAPTRDEAYTPTLYATGDSQDTLADLGHDLLVHPDVLEAGLVEKRRGWRHDPEPILRVDVAGMAAITPVARTIRSRGDADVFRCYDVDLVHRSEEPLQELSWAFGTILTAIQIRMARLTASSSRTNAATSWPASTR